MKLKEWGATLTAILVPLGIIVTGAVYVVTAISSVRVELKDEIHALETRITTVEFRIATIEAKLDKALDMLERPTTTASR